MRQGIQFRERGGRAAFVAVLFAAFAGWGFSPAWSADPTVGESVAPDAKTSDWFDEMEAYFEARPEAKTTKGSGWKPYNRVKWHYEQRMVNGAPVPLGGRYEAWKAINEVKASLPSPRSTWFALGPNNFAGRILALEYDPNTPNTLYAGAAGGGLWRSTNSGVGWEPLTDEGPTLAIGGVAVDPTDSNILVIGTGEGTPNIDRITGVGILRSTDAGATWNNTNVNYSLANGHGFHVVEANPLNGTFLAGATDGLWRSVDHGATWTQVIVGSSCTDVVWKPGDANVCYTIRTGAGAASGIHVSTNDGANWALAGTGQPTVTTIGKTKLAVSAAQPDWVYAGIAHRTTNNLLGVYRSTDNGATWQLRASTPNMYGGQGWYNVSLAADPNNADRLISGGVDLYSSTNGGSSFVGIGGNVHVDHHAAAYKPGSPNTLVVGSDGGVWESTTDGGSWGDRNTGLMTFQFYDICVSQLSPTWVMGGTQDNGTDKWSGTTTWSDGLFADGMVCNINPSSSTVMYAEIQSGDHYKSTNGGGGGGWTNIMNGITGTGSWVTPVAEDQTPGNGNHLYTASSAGIFRTTNGGTQWVNVTTGNATWIDISPVDGNVVWAVNGSQARRTTNDGTTWTTCAPYGFFASGATKVAAHPTNVDAAFVTFSGFSAGFAHVALTTDGGATWANLTSNLPNLPVNAIAVDPEDPDQIFVGHDLGVWTTTDGGANWAPFDTGLPNSEVVDLEIQKSARKLVAGTHGRGAWEAALPTSSTDVVVGAPAPMNLMFDPPSPNPVSKETLLRFAARSSAPVTVAVYDVAGRLVTEVASFSAGDGVIRMAQWFADDVPAGVYFAVLQAGEDRLSHKIVVTK